MSGRLKTWKIWIKCLVDPIGSHTRNPYQHEPIPARTHTSTKRKREVPHACRFCLDQQARITTRLRVVLVFLQSSPPIPARSASERFRTTDAAVWNSSNKTTRLRVVLVFLRPSRTNTSTKRKREVPYDWSFCLDQAGITTRLRVLLVFLIPAGTNTSTNKYQHEAQARGSAWTTNTKKPRPNDWSGFCVLVRICRQRLTLGELSSATGTVKAGLLTLFHSRIASQEASVT